MRILAAAFREDGQEAMEPVTTPVAAETRDDAFIRLCRDLRELDRLAARARAGDSPDDRSAVYLIEAALARRAAALRPLDGDGRISPLCRTA